MAAPLDSLQTDVLEQLSTLFDSDELGVAQEDWGIVDALARWRNGVVRCRCQRS